MLLSDLRQALLALASRPAFTTVTILSLALAIGAETSVSALIRAVFDRPPIGVAEPNDVVAISAATKGQPVEDAIRFPDYVYLRDHNTVFSDLASHFNSGVGLVDSARGEELNGHVGVCELLLGGRDHATRWALFRCGRGSRSRSQRGRRIEPLVLAASLRR